MWLFKHRNEVADNTSCRVYPDTYTTPISALNLGRRCSSDSERVTEKEANAVGFRPHTVAHVDHYKLRSAWRSSFTDSLQRNKARTGPLRLLSELNDSMYQTDTDSIAESTSSTAYTILTSSTLTSPASFADEVKATIKTTLNDPMAPRRASAVCESVQSLYIFEDGDDISLSGWSDDTDTETAVQDDEKPGTLKMSKCGGFEPVPRKSQDRVDASAPPEARREPPTFFNTTRFKSSACAPEVSSEHESEGDAEFDFTDSFRGQTPVMRARQSSLSALHKRLNTPSAISLRQRVLPFIRITRSTLPSLYQLGIIDSTNSLSESQGYQPVSVSQRSRPTVHAKPTVHEAKPVSKQPHAAPEKRFERQWMCTTNTKKAPMHVRQSLGLSGQYTIPELRNINT